jgi:hypothetical protein
MMNGEPRRRIQDRPSRRWTGAPILFASELPHLRHKTFVLFQVFVQLAH